jgi:regulator of sirC expression with transglutaminase-like and TPR domain
LITGTGPLDLLRAGLLVAKEEYPSLNVDLYLRRFDGLVTDAKRHLGSTDPSAPRAVELLNDFFFGYAGFLGNSDDYYDPRNSYLNDVIDRRLGIPITLSVLYAEMGRRVGVSAHGISFPGRYLVKCGAGRGEVIVDCFDGRAIDRDGCQALLDAMYGGRLKLNPDMLRTSTPRETLGRMLNNLRGVFTQRKAFPRALRYLNLAMTVQPDNVEFVRDRGLLLLQMEEFGRAIDDLAEYLRREPEAADAVLIREHLQLSQKLLVRLN